MQRRFAWAPTPLSGGSSTHRVSVEGFCIDAFPGDEPGVLCLRRETGYVTVAERPLDPSDFPGAPPENLVPGSLVFTMTAGPVDLRNLTQWWTWTPGACGGTRRAGRVRSKGAAIIPSCTSPSRMQRHTRPGPARSCRARRSGSSPRAAASRSATSSGATSRRRPASGSPTTGTATSPGDLSRATAPGAGRLVPGQRARAVRHGRQRLGVDERLVQPSTSE